MHIAIKTEERCFLLPQPVSLFVGEELVSSGIFSPWSRHRSTQRVNKTAQAQKTPKRVLESGRENKIEKGTEIESSIVHAGNNKQGLP